MFNHVQSIQKKSDESEVEQNETNGFKKKFSAITVFKVIVTLLFLTLIVINVYFLYKLIQQARKFNEAYVIGLMILQAASGIG